MGLTGKGKAILMQSEPQPLACLIEQSCRASPSRCDPHLLHYPLLGLTRGASPLGCCCSSSSTHSLDHTTCIHMFGCQTVASHSRRCSACRTGSRLGVIPHTP